MSYSKRILPHHRAAACSMFSYQNQCQKCYPPSEGFRWILQQKPFETKQNVETFSNERIEDKRGEERLMDGVSRGRKEDQCD